MPAPTLLATNRHDSVEEAPRPADASNRPAGRSSSRAAARDLEDVIEVIDLRGAQHSDLPQLGLLAVVGMACGAFSGWWFVV